MQLVGRSSSHFTRVVAIIAHELGVPYELVPIPTLRSLDADSYGDNPALKLPTLRLDDGALVFGTENICRRLVALAPAGPRVVLPEHVDGAVARNAQEMAWHAMAAQVQLVLGASIGGLAAGNPWFDKLTAGFHGAFGWLDAHLDAALAELPAPRTTSVLEVTLFCVLDHLAFRPTISPEPYPRLRAFLADFAARPSAQRTPYRFDQVNVGSSAASSS
jgi:glutathione S-transferase